MYQHLFLARPSGDESRQGAAGRQAPRRARLKSEQWQAILGWLADNVGSLLVRVALAHADGEGHQTVRWRPLQTARYDAESDELELTVAVERGATLRYLVSRPRCLKVEAQLGEHVLRVHDASGLETVIRVRASDGSCGADTGPAAKG